MRLVLSAEAKLVGYWFDGSATVNVTVSLRNEGDLAFDGSQTISVTSCRTRTATYPQHCSGGTSLSLPDGYGPAEETFPIHAPAGDLSLNLSGQGVAATMSLSVPARIAGVDREVWECFSDTFYLDTIRVEERGVGCSGLKEPIQKWDQSSPIRVWTSGPEGFVAKFKETLKGLKQVMGLSFRWVEDKNSAHLHGYIGLTREETRAQGAFCASFEAFGCATRLEPWNPSWGDKPASLIIVYNREPSVGLDYDDLEEQRKTKFRGAMLHEAVHALSGMLHRTERLSVMLPALHDRAQLSPMDESLLRLQGHKLIRSGMTRDEIERLIIFDDELLSPKPEDSRLQAWSLTTNAYRGLREAVTASYKARVESPGCSQETDWVEYQAGNLKNSYFRWTKVEQGDNLIYSIRLSPYEPYAEHWGKTRFEVWSRIDIASALPGWAGDLVDPHRALEATLDYADWSDTTVATDASGRITLEVRLNLTDSPRYWQAVEGVDVTLVLDEDTLELTSYVLDYDLEGVCDKYRVEATEGSYGAAFTFPDAVRQGSYYLDACEEESIGSLDGYVKRVEYWVRECEASAAHEGYSRRFSFSLEDWAFVRFELVSEDDIKLNLYKRDEPVELEDSGYLIEGRETRKDERIRWAQLPLPAGAYTVEAVSENRVIPRDFTLKALAQRTPAPPYRFKSISAGRWRTCGLLEDGMPLCWGQIRTKAEGGGAPEGTFASITAEAGHTCGLREDGTPACWDFLKEGEHNCHTRDDGSTFCERAGQRIPEGDASGGSSASVVVIRGYHALTPPEGETFTWIGAASIYACGLREDGTAKCWGNNQHERFPPPEERFIALDLGWSHACGLKEDGSVECWGADSQGQTSAPQGVKFTAITAGSSSSCGLREDGSIECWGSGGGNLCRLRKDGRYDCNPGHYNDYIPPAPQGEERFASLCSGEPHCALREDGSAACWTQFKSGLESPPQDERFISLASSIDHACGLRENGSIVCWGRNRMGQASPLDGG